MTKKSPEKSQQSAHEFLAQHHFFDYQNTEAFLPQLDAQITERLKLDNPLTIVFPGKLEDHQFKKSYLVMDLGGTYLRLYFCKNNGKNEPKILAESRIPFYQDKVYTAEIFLADLTKAIGEFLASKGIMEMAGFSKTMVFSFGNAMKPELRDGRVDGSILYWGKNHRQKDLLGLKLGLALEKYLDKNGPGLSVHAINDSSLSTLAGLGLATPGDCLASIVVGTGTNINVGFHHQEKFYLANLEYGDFEFFPYSTFDQELNTRLATPNHFRTEKLFAGAWQNLLMAIMVEFAEKAKLIASGSTKLFAKADAAELENWFNLDKPTDHPPMKPEDWYFCQEMWSAMMKRGAALCAVAITRLGLQLKQLGYLEKQLILVPTGALLEHSEFFQQDFHNSLEQNLATNALNINVLQSENPTCMAASALLNLLGG